MRKNVIPHCISQIQQPELRNQEVIKYKVWTKAFGNGNWSDTGNWNGGIKPSGGSNVLFGPYQGVCIVNEDTPVLGGFRVRYDYTSVITSTKIISLNGYLTYHSDGTFSTNTTIINANSGDVRIDGDGRIFWDNSVWNVSGSFDQKTLNTPVDNFSTINMLGSEKKLYSEDELNIVNISNNTIATGDLVIKGPLNISGTLVIATGSNVINRGVSADVSIYTSGITSGPGSLVLEQEASIVRQQGFIGNTNLVVRNNNVGEVLPAAIYNARRLTITNQDASYNTFVFGTGTYHFDGDVNLESIGGGTLEINNRFKGAVVNFNRDINVTTGNFSNMVWITGAGQINLNKATSISREFARYSDGRGAINVVATPRGLVTSRKNVINEAPIIWLAELTGIAPLALFCVTNEGHTVGGITVGSVTGNAIGDITHGRTPQTTNEQLYIGDIADPTGIRSVISVYQVAEPVVTGFGFSDISSFRVYSGSYESGLGIPLGENGGNPRDCRALFCEYVSSDFYFISHKTNPAQLFRMTGHATHPNLETLFYQGTLRLGSGIVGADISRDSRQIIVKTWDKVYYYSVNGTGNTNIVAALTGTTPIEILDYNPGYQEHGITFGSGDNSFYTMETFNELLHDPLLRSPFWHYDKRAYINTSGLLLDKINVTANQHTKKLTSNLYTRDFSLISGTFDLGSHNVTSLKDFYAGPSGDFNRRGFVSGATIACTGDFIMVGSPTRDLSMHPDSGDGGWVLHCNGNARAYWTSVRASNAASGSIVYAYNSSNYGANTNWVFSTGGPSSGFIYLTISGTNNVAPANNTIPLSIMGKAGSPTGILFLTISGANIGNLYADDLYLYISGTYRGAPTGGIPLYISNTGISNSIPLFISGGGLSTGSIPRSSVLYLTIGNSGISGGIPLSIIGGGSQTGGIPLSIIGHTPVTGGLPLITTGTALVGVGGPFLRLISHGRHASN